MYAADFRARARQALSGNWGIAILAGLVALLLGGNSLEGPKLQFNFDSSTGSHLGGVNPASLVNLPPWVSVWLASGTLMLVLCAVAISLLLLAVGSAVSVGYARFNLKLVDGERPQMGDLFEYFSWFKTALCARLLTILYTFLWSLLLVIPGIVASYSYAMTPYILAEYPQLTASQAIQRSKELMQGNRWRLFCLRISFIGWTILCAFTFGIGSLVLTPYEEAATAAFYRDITRPGPVPGFEF